MTHFRRIISYDFDGVCHVSVVGLDPINYDRPETWVPNLEIHASMRADAVNNKIIIVTARHPNTNVYLWEFIRMYKLPVEEIYATNLEPKVPYLKKLKVIKHYDDNCEMTEPMRRAGIEFTLVSLT